jgi:hypothetical protein
MGSVAPGPPKLDDLAGPYSSNDNQRLLDEDAAQLGKALQRAVDASPLPIRDIDEDGTPLYGRARWMGAKFLAKDFKSVGCDVDIVGSGQLRLREPESEGQRDRADNFASECLGTKVAISRDGVLHFDPCAFEKRLCEFIRFCGAGGFRIL